MRLRPPTNKIVNGCSCVALAATIGGKPADFVQYGNTWRGRFIGMTDEECLIALHDKGIGFTMTRHMRCERHSLAKTLPLDGRGVVSCSRGHHHHMLAFEGKMVYDGRTRGRWMWVYDHPWATASVRKIILVKEAT